MLIAFLSGISPAAAYGAALAITAFAIAVVFVPGLAKLRRVPGVGQARAQAGQAVRKATKPFSDAILAGKKKVALVRSFVMGIVALIFVVLALVSRANLSSDYERRLADRDARHAEEIARLEKEHEADLANEKRTCQIRAEGLTQRSDDLKEARDEFKVKFERCDADFNRLKEFAKSREQELLDGIKELEGQIGDLQDELNAAVRPPAQ